MIYNLKHANFEKIPQIFRKKKRALIIPNIINSITIVMETQSFYCEEGSKFVSRHLFILTTRLKKSVTLKPGLSFKFHESL